MAQMISRKKFSVYRFSKTFIIINRFITDVGGFLEVYLNKQLSKCASSVSFNKHQATLEVMVFRGGMFDL